MRPRHRRRARRRVRTARYRRYRRRRILLEQGVALVLTLDRKSTRGLGLAPSRRLDPLGPEGRNVGMVAVTPHARVERARPQHDQSARRDPRGAAAASLSLHLAPPLKTTAKVRNVIGMLRGSDPKLRESYVLVSAHYDHLGQRPSDEERQDL